MSKRVCDKDMKVLICIYKYSKKDFTPKTLEQWTTLYSHVNIRLVKDAAKILEFVTTGILEIEIHPASSPMISQ